jgi:uncharacterized iron-regulated membrane protein
MRRFMRQVHLWMGLSLGALFVLLGLTGSILVFYPEIDAALHPEIRITGGAPDWDRALATAREAFPDKQGAWRFEVTGDPGAIPARYYNPPETSGRDFAPMMVWLSPDGGHVLRRDYWGDYAMTWIYDLHYRLLLGETGGTVLGYAGMALLLLLLSGLWAWWPRGSWRKALRYKGNAPASRKLRDIHKLSGLWGIGLLVILSVTGVMLELPKGSDTVLGGMFGPVDALPKPVSKSDQGPQLRVATALLAARQALPHARIAWIEIPGAGDGTFRIRMQQPGDPSRRFPHSFVWIDQYGGQVLGVTDSAKSGRAAAINNWVHPLHDGSAAGVATRILTTLAGVVPLILLITGWLRWRRRVRVPSRPAVNRSLGIASNYRSMVDEE